MILGMNSDAIKTEDEFFQEFMDLEEFINVSTKSDSLPESTHFPYETETFGTPDTKLPIQSAMLANEQHCVPGKHMNDVTDAQGVTNFNEPTEGVSNSIAGNRTEDKQSTSGTSECNSVLAAGVVKDKKYWDRRYKNNIAAKRSRDAKRLKESSVVQRWTFLEEENKRLKEQISSMKRRLQAANANDVAV